MVGWITIQENCNFDSFYLVVIQMQILFLLASFYNHHWFVFICDPIVIPIMGLTFDSFYNIWCQSLKSTCKCCKDLIHFIFLFRLKIIAQIVEVKYHFIWYELEAFNHSLVFIMFHFDRSRARGGYYGSFNSEKSSTRLRNGVILKN